MEIIEPHTSGSIKKIIRCRSYKVSFKFYMLFFCDYLYNIIVFVMVLLLITTQSYDSRIPWSCSMIPSSGF